MNDTTLISEESKAELPNWPRHKFSEQEDFYTRLSSSASQRQKKIAEGVWLSLTENHYHVIDENHNDLLYLLTFEKSKGELTMEGASKEVTVVHSIFHWREHVSLYTRDLSEWIFWSRLLEKDTLIVGDCDELSNEGGFWANRVGEALAYGVKVGLWNFSDNSIHWYSNAQNYREATELMRANKCNSSNRVVFKR